MTALEASRFGDEIAHTSAWSGLLWGLAAGLVVGLALVATIATGGLLGVALGAVFVAGMSATGGLIGMSIGQRDDDNPTGDIGSGSPNVLTVGRKQARAKVDFVNCDNHGVKYIATGSSTVFVNREMAARRTDQTECDGKLMSDQDTVFIGGETALAPGMTISPEVPEWLVTTLTVVSWAGMAAGAALLVPIIGVVGTGLSLAVSFVGGEVGARIGRSIGAHFWGDDGAFYGELIGGFAGSAVGGGRSARMGARIEARVLPRETLAAMPGRTQVHMRARRVTLQRELTRKVGDWKPTRAEMESKVQGTDITKPVRVGNLEENTQFQMLRNQGQGPDGKGNWVAKHGTEPDTIGLGEYGLDRNLGRAVPKESATVTVQKGARYVKSTAAPINDTWSVSTRPRKGRNGQPDQQGPSAAGEQWAPGGGEQIYIHDKGRIVDVPEPYAGTPITPKGPPPKWGAPPPDAPVPAPGLPPEPGWAAPAFQNPPVPDDEGDP